MCCVCGIVLLTQHFHSARQFCPSIKKLINLEMCVEKSKVVIKEKRVRRPSKLKKMFKELARRLLFQVIAFAHLVKNVFLELILGWYLGERKTCPALRDNQFLTKSAIDLARMIRKREITSTQLVRACIDRINEVNGLLNAVADGPFDDALVGAKLVDEQIANGQLGDKDFVEKPLLGVPFSTKDSTSVEGKLNTYGLLSRRTVRAKQDAECVALVKKAGAIVLATTNIPEVNKWQETRSTLFGQTNNPYDTRRTVGGSSGGEGALLAACATCFSLGSDIGGSIRMPAFYCGVFGHKPTVGLVNTRGITHRTGKEPHTMVVAGPMSRYARDLRPLMKVLVGHKLSKTLKLDDTTDVRKLKYYYVRENQDIRCGPVGGELQSTMTKVLDHITELTGERPREIKLPGADYTSKMWRYWMTREPADFNLLLGNGVKLNPLIELGKKLIGRSDFTMASIYSLIDELLPKENADKMKELTRRCDEELNKILGEDGILIYHSCVHTAPFHYSLLINVYNFSYWSLFNVLNVPATQVPLGLDSKGLPLGIQVVATRNRDRHCLAVAEELDSAFNGYVPPFAS